MLYYTFMTNTFVYTNPFPSKFELAESHKHALARLNSPQIITTLL